jgi:hypothetical protein
MPVDGREIDAVGIEERMEAIRLKQILGGALSQQELMCLQMEQHGFGCSSGCGAEATRPLELQ